MARLIGLLILLQRLVSMTFFLEQEEEGLPGGVVPGLPQPVHLGSRW
jgi:hypothetical protein